MSMGDLPNIFLNFFLQRLEVLITEVLLLLVRVIPRYFAVFVAVVKGDVSLNFFSQPAYCLYKGGQLILFYFQLILYPVTLLKVFISCRSSLVELLGLLMYHVIWKQWCFDFFLSNLYSLDLLSYGLVQNFKYYIEQIVRIKGQPCRVSYFT